MAVRLRVVVIVRPTAPQGALVDLITFVLYTSKDHGSEPAIAERNSFRPLRSRLVKMKLRLGLCPISEGDENCARKQ